MNKELKFEKFPVFNGELEDVIRQYANYYSIRYYNMYDVKNTVLHIEHVCEFQDKMRPTNEKARRFRDAYGFLSNAAVWDVYGLLVMELANVSLLNDEIDLAAATIAAFEVYE